jgi:hypothetical protein
MRAAHFLEANLHKFARPTIGVLFAFVEAHGTTVSPVLTVTGDPSAMKAESERAPSESANLRP